MRGQMHFRVSIFLKILLFILPLVCIPIFLVGYFSMEASVERVNRLVRQEQMVMVEGAADKINQVFQNCRIDIETIARLPVLEDYYLARTFRLDAEARFNRENLVKLFRDMIGRTAYYYRIRLLDKNGRELIVVNRNGDASKLRDRGQAGYFRQASAMGPENMFFSAVANSKERRGFLLYCAKPFMSGWRELAGVLLIDLDFEKIIELVRRMQVGQKGYSFLLDPQGYTLVHPTYAPYADNPSKSNELSLMELAKEMTSGATGWDTYTYQGQEKVAAYAPIPVMKWSLAVTIPIEEFGREARSIRSQVIQLVVIIIIITLLGVSVLSYNLLRPVRRLVAATNRLASGDMEQEIPVQSRDELGDLTRSFNRMVRNLKKIQDELVRSEKLISLGRLSAGVAHEIRNPLNAMKGAMVHLKQRWSDEPLIQQYASLVSEEIDRLNRVVSDFLYFAKQSPPKREKLDLNACVLGAQELLAGQAAERGVGFANELDPDMPEASLDAHQMEQVLLNLIINALDASRPGQEIFFSSGFSPQSNPSQVWLAIEDQGGGIAKEDLSNVFDPFFTTKEDGTGLGLPLSLGIVESHGGTLELVSEPGKGCKATIILPLSGQQTE